jgi:TorA maturation chaperone TorD
VKHELTPEISAEDVLRANLYKLLAHTLRAGPGRQDLQQFAKMRGDTTPIGKAVSAIARVAAASSAGEVAMEYDALFGGDDRPEVSTYRSSYFTAALNEVPLARLRADMNRLGIEFRSDVDEPEDHIAALCEMMAGLILGDFGEALDVEGQKLFFSVHLGTWGKRFFTDLEAARKSVFYACIGRLGAAFMQVEERAFALV